MATDRGYPWLKFYPTLLDDPKYLRISNGAKARYIEFYLLAGKADAGGLVVIGDDVASAEDLAFVLHVELEQVEAHIAELLKSTLLTQSCGGYLITRFREEQGPSQADKRTEWKLRQDKKRGKFKPVPAISLVTVPALDDEALVVEEEVTRESRVTSRDVTVTPNKDAIDGQTPLLLLPASFFGKIAKLIGKDCDIKRLREAEQLWLSECQDIGWNVLNEGAFQEFYMNLELKANKRDSRKALEIEQARLEAEKQAEREAYNREHYSFYEPGDVFIEEDTRYRSSGEEVICETWRKPSGKKLQRINLEDVDAENAVLAEKNRQQREGKK